LPPDELSLWRNAMAESVNQVSSCIEIPYLNHQLLLQEVSYAGGGVFQTLDCQVQSLLLSWLAEMSPA